MKPIIGQMVLYQSKAITDDSPEVSPAIITKVIEDGERCRMFVIGEREAYYHEAPYSYDFKPGHWSYTDGDRRIHGLLREIDKGIVSKKEMEITCD